MSVVFQLGTGYWMHQLSKIQTQGQGLSISILSESMYTWLLKIYVVFVKGTVGSQTLNLEFSSLFIRYVVIAIHIWKNINLVKQSVKSLAFIKRGTVHSILYIVVNLVYTFVRAGHKEITVDAFGGVRHQFFVAEARKCPTYYSFYVLSPSIVWY